MAGVRKIAKQRSPWISNAFAKAAFTVGAEVANAINCAVQLQDDNGGNVKAFGQCLVYLSDSADGHQISVTVPDTSVVIGTNGKILITEVTKLAFTVVSDSLGRFDLTITDATAHHTYYLVVCMPDGSISVSPVIQF